MVDSPKIWAHGLTSSVESESEGEHSDDSLSVDMSFASNGCVYVKAAGLSAVFQNFQM